MHISKIVDRLSSRVRIRSRKQRNRIKANESIRARLLSHGSKTVLWQQSNFVGEDGD